MELFTTPQPKLSELRNRYIYYPDVADVPEFHSTNIRNCSPRPPIWNGSGSDTLQERGREVRHGRRLGCSPSTTVSQELVAAALQHDRDDPARRASFTSGLAASRAAPGPRAQQQHPGLHPVAPGAGCAVRRRGGSTEPPGARRGRRVICFALTHYVVVRSDETEFAGLRTKTDARYFAVTTPAIVGSGDIPAQGQLARQVVTVQMVFDLGVLAGAAWVLMRGISQRPRTSRRAGSRSEGVVPVHGQSPDHRDVQRDDQQ